MFQSFTPKQRNKVGWRVCDRKELVQDQVERKGREKRESTHTGAQKEANETAGKQRGKEREEKQKTKRGLSGERDSKMRCW